MNFDLAYRVVRRLDGDGDEGWFIGEIVDMSAVPGKSVFTMREVSETFPSLEELEAGVGFMKDTFESMKNDVFTIGRKECQ
jgi:hypothetical protein